MAYIAFVKYGVRPGEFMALPENERAAIVAFMQQHAKDEEKAMKKGSE